MKRRHLTALLFVLSFPAFGSVQGCGCSCFRSGPPPAAPSLLLALGLTSGRVVLAWTDNSTNETGFTIERSVDGGLNWSTVGSVAADVIGFTDLGLHPDQLVRYRVHPTNYSGSASSPLPVTLDPVTWGAPAGGAGLPSEPDARIGASAVYDDLNARLIVFGGLSGINGLLNEVWALDLSGPALGGWTQLFPGAPMGAPVGRFNHAAVYDPENDQMVVFGGEVELGSPPLIGDAWALSLPSVGTPAWTPLTSVGAPTPRARMSAVYDPNDDRMLVFAGDDLSGVPLSDFYALNLPLAGTPSWTSLGTAPIQRSSHVAAYDPPGRRMVVHGGYGDNFISNETWQVSLPAAGPPVWSRIFLAGPSARIGASAVTDEANRRMLLFGGLDGSPLPGAGFNDVWVLSLVSGGIWMQAAPLGTAPAVRGYSGFAYDRGFERMLVFSGDDGSLPGLSDDLAFPLDLDVP